MAESGEFTAVFIYRERSFPGRLAKKVSGSGCFSVRRGGLGVFENQGAFVVEVDFLGFPSRALVKAIGIGIGWFPGTVEPVKVGFVVGNAFAASWRRIETKIRRRILLAAWPERSVGNPFFDRLPRWLDGLERFDVEGRRRRAWELDDAFPQSVEAEKELDFLRADDLPDGFHGALAAGALERIAPPYLGDEVAPEGAHLAGGLLGRGGGGKTAFPPTPHAADQASDPQRLPTHGTPGYLVTSLRAGWQVNDHLELTCGVENLTDEDYRNHGSGQNEPGFGGIFGAKIRW